jgi:hypothetical protein
MTVLLYEVVCPDGLVRHSPFAIAEHAEYYARFANRGGDSEEVKEGKDCEPGLPYLPVCKIPPPGRVQAHWVRDTATRKPLLEPCPACGARLTMPAEPTYDIRGGFDGFKGFEVAVDVPCPGCPAAITYIVDTGHICCIRPNQPLQVCRVGEGR